MARCVEPELSVDALSTVKRQSQHFHYLARYQMPPLFGNGSLPVQESRFWQKVDPVATNQRFPVQAISLVQHFFGRLRPAVYRRGGAEQGVDFFDLVIAARLVIGDDDSRMAPFPGKRKHDDVPLVQGDGWVIRDPLEGR
jgi:hypothetical protein